MCKIDRNYTLKYEKKYSRKKYILLFPNNEFSIFVLLGYFQVLIYRILRVKFRYVCVSANSFIIIWNNIIEIDFPGGERSIDRRSVEGHRTVSRYFPRSFDVLPEILYSRFFWSREIITYGESCFYFLLIKIRKVFNQLLRNLNRFLFYLEIWQQ